MKNPTLVLIAKCAALPLFFAYSCFAGATDSVYLENSRLGEGLKQTLIQEITSRCSGVKNLKEVSEEFDGPMDSNGIVEFATSNDSIRVNFHYYGDGSLYYIDQVKSLGASCR